MKSTKFKQNILAKLGINMAAAVLGMMSGANLSRMFWQLLQHLLLKIKLQK